MLSQITSHGLALTDPNVWSGPAASNFASGVWPQVQTQLNQVTGVLGGLQNQVSGVLNTPASPRASSSPGQAACRMSSLPLGHP